MNTWNLTSSESFSFMLHLREFLLADNNLQDVAHLWLPKFEDKSPIILAIKMTDVHSFMDNTGNQWNFKQNGNIYGSERTTFTAKGEPIEHRFVNTPEGGWSRCDEQDFKSKFNWMWKQITPPNDFFETENKTRVLGDIVKNVLKINPDLTIDKGFLHYLRDMRISDPENSEIIRSLRASEMIKGFKELPFHYV